MARTSTRSVVPAAKGTKPTLRSTASADLVLPDDSRIALRFYSLREARTEVDFPHLVPGEARKAKEVYIDPAKPERGEIPRDDLDRGFSSGDPRSQTSRFVRVSREERERLDGFRQIPKDRQRIEVCAVLPRREMPHDARLGKAYGLLPATTGDRAYATLARALGTRWILARLRVGKFSCDGLAAIRAERGLLLCERLHWPAHLRRDAESELREIATSGAATTRERVAALRERLAPAERERLADVNVPQDHPYAVALSAARDAALAGESIDEALSREVARVARLARKTARSAIAGGRSRKRA